MAARGSTWTENAERLGRVRVTWAPSSTPSAAYKVYFRNASRLQGWELAAVNYNVGSPLEWGWSYPTGGGERYEFKVEAFNLAGVATGPVASVLPTPTKRDIYLGFTGVVIYGWDYPIPQGLDTFLAAKNAPSNWSRYNFDWTDNACSTPAHLGEILNAYDETYQDACRRHDFGYRNHTPIEFELDEPSLKRRVDLTLRYDMRDLCFRDFPNVIDIADLMGCLTISDVSYQAVDRFGWPSWTAATADD